MKFKLIAAFLLYGAILVLPLFFGTYELVKENVHTLSVKEAKEVYISRYELFQTIMDDARKTLTALAESRQLHAYITDPKEVECVSALFESMMASHSYFMQLRYIDGSGMERIRFDRSAYGETIRRRSQEYLQDKSERYYTKELLAQSPGQMWYSNFDLNVEHGRIQEPHEPMLRVGYPVVSEDASSGFIIVNLCMRQFWNHTQRSVWHNVYFVDKNGNFLFHINPNHSWSAILDRDVSAHTEFNGDAYCILNNQECFGDRVYSNLLGLNNGEGIRMVIEPRWVAWQEEQERQAGYLALLLVATLVASIPLAYLFARMPASFQKQVDQLNRKLQAKIDEKVEELKRLNNVLEEQVHQRTEELEQANAKLFKSATTDYLTGIANRRYFFEVGERYLELAHRKQLPLSLMIIDIDHFKKVNDTYGHEAGDTLLVCVTNAMTQRLRKSDVLGRIGGEEFVILLSDTTIEQAAHFAESLIQSIRETSCSYHEETIGVTVSIGISQIEPDETGLTEALQRADAALYRAKKGGRDRVESMA